MKRITKRSSIIAVTAAFTLVVGGGVAFAYWSTSGSGTAEAAVAATAGTLTVTQDGSIGGLYPGGPAQDVNVIVTNATDADLSFSDVTVAVTSTSAGTGCTAADFDFVDTAYAGEIVPANSSTAVITPKRIQMLNRTSVNQDACKNATITLSLTAS